jgi:pimeloyl-ACP methyl ester carboxylesterase
MSRARVWLKRGLFGLVTLVLGLVAAGAIYQAVATELDRRTFPPPGLLVDVGGYRLHLYCTGEDQPGVPTVVLETMGQGSLVNWAWVQPELSKQTRVCSYDRAGFGWSDASPHPHSLQAVVRDLHSLLTRAGIAGPYVLVGHSQGGVIVRQYAADHPTDVAGIVQVDSSHPDQFARHPEYLDQVNTSLPLLRAAPVLARLGLMRWYVAAGGFDFGGLPARERAVLAAEWSTSKYWDSSLASILTLQSFYAEAHSLGSLGGVPLIIVTAGDNDRAGWNELQRELAALSPHSTHTTVEGASHVSLAFNLEHAQATVQAVRDLLNLMR